MAKDHWDDAARRGNRYPDLGDIEAPELDGGSLDEIARKITEGVMVDFDGPQSDGPAVGDMAGQSAGDSQDGGGSDGAGNTQRVVELLTTIATEVALIREGMGGGEEEAHG